MDWPGPRTLVAGESQKKRFYYRVEAQTLAKKERVLKAVVLLAKTIFSLFIMLFSSTIRSQWREVFYGCREIQVLGTDCDIRVDTHKKIPLVEKQALAIQHYVHLKKLHIGDSHKPSFPKATQFPQDFFAKFRQLKVLELPNNGLEQLPPSIEPLKQLEKIDFQVNYMETFPSFLSQFKNLKVLNLQYNCLARLPSEIGHLKNLEFLGLKCNRLTSLPVSLREMSNLMRLDLEDNALETIPECLFHLPRRCVINLERNPLNAEEIERLQERTSDVSYRGPAFLFSMEYLSENFEHPILPLQETLFEWLNTDPEALFQNLTPAQQKDLSFYLCRLKETSDFKHEFLRVRLQRRVQEILVWLGKVSQEEKIIIFLIIRNALAACGDAIAHSLNDLLIMKKIAESPHMPLEELKALIIGIRRYEILSKIAEEKCRTLNAVDPMEVYLHFETALKDSLNLPLGIGSMLYERISGVTLADIENARVSILAMSTGELEMDLLIQHPLWQKRLQQNPKFSALQETCEKEKKAWSEENGNNAMSPRVAALYKKNERTAWNPYYLLTTENK